MGGEGSLEQYYKLNFGLLYHHKIMPEVFDNMVPWEKDLYIKMLIAKVSEENEKLKMDQSASRARNKRS
jgi:hypothetical protein